VKLALDPYMFRATPLLELPGLVADLGYRYIELSPREDPTSDNLVCSAGSGDQREGVA
jgi:sugar phosphate isomerase/epimerase